MFKHILIPTDGSDLSHKALHYGIELAKEHNAKVTAVTVRSPYAVGAVDMVGVVGDQVAFEEEARAFAENALDEARVAGDSAGVPVETVQEVADQPYRAIIECAAKQGCDLIVMASHGRRGMSALLLGSETVDVLSHSTIPVLVYR